MGCVQVRGQHALVEFARDLIATVALLIVVYGGAVVVRLVMMS
jgi:hypothetical protein